MPFTHSTKSPSFSLYWTDSLFPMDSEQRHSQAVELSHSSVTSFSAWKSLPQALSSWQSFCICDPFYCPLLALTFWLEIIPVGRNLCPFIVHCFPGALNDTSQQSITGDMRHWDPVCHPLIRYLCMQGPFTTASCPERLFHKCFNQKSWRGILDN